MKDLSQFSVVKQALEQVIAESDVNNGTQGLVLMAHFWQQDNMYDKKRDDLRNLIAASVLEGKIDEVKAKQAELEKLPKPKIMMIFNLLTPIPRLQGTKRLMVEDKVGKLSMIDVKTLYIPEDAVKLGLLEFDETDEMAKDAMGRETPIIKLKISKGLIDVAAPKKDRLGNLRVAKRAIVTAVSYDAMQVASEFIYKNKMQQNRRYGFDFE